MVKRDNTAQLWLGLAVTRVLLGVVFLWAFFDKLFGLGYATTAEHSWLNGGSPTTGFLSHVQGPFESLFSGLSGVALVDWLFMLGLLGIGVALVLGIGMRLAAWGGALLMVLMWAASLPLANNPVIDEHIIYAVVLLVLGWALPQQQLSLAGWWKRQSFVKTNSWLQ